MVGRSISFGMEQVSVRQHLGPGQTLGNHSFPGRTLKVHQQFLDLKKLFSWSRKAIEALNVQREAARRTLLHQQGDFLAATHQYEAAARQNLVSALARHNEAHNFKCANSSSTASNKRQMRDSLKVRGNCYLGFPRKQIISRHQLLNQIVVIQDMRFEI